MSRAVKNKRLFGKVDGVKNPSDKVSRKISHLVEEEGKSQEEAVAQALSMEERGDL